MQDRGVGTRDGARLAGGVARTLIQKSRNNYQEGRKLLSTQQGNTSPTLNQVVLLP